MTGRRGRGALIGLVVALALLIGVGLGVRALYRAVTAKSIVSQCVTGNFSVENDQASVASRMVAVVLKRGLPERAAVLAIAAALQESKLRNLSGGDRDSVGILQQRPSQGWGTVEQIMDISYATGKFLDRVVKVPNWQNSDLADTIQAVQISADGSEYAKHEPLAQALADALTGVTPAGLNCTFSSESQEKSSAAEVVAQLTADLPVTAPQINGQTLTVPGASWPTAEWLVGNAQRLGIATVSYAGKKWNPKDGWRTDTSAPSTQVTATVAI